MMEEIEKLEAGPELDALIAEKVMGLVPCEQWIDGMGTLSIIHRGDCDAPIKLQCHDAKPGRWTKRYSTDISAAWEVVEKLTPQFIDFELGNRRNELFNADFIWGHGLRQYFRANANTAPLAVCRAALKAVQSR